VEGLCDITSAVYVPPARFDFVVSVGSWECVTPERVCSNFLFLGGVLGAGTGPVVERDTWDTRPLRSIAIV